MTLAIVFSRASTGILAPLVTVETHVPKGMPKFNIVGLPEAAVKESRDRVRSALINSCFDFPARRITVNLAPADLPKEGGRFDLPIALGILAASGQIPANKLSEYEFVGELALSGELRPIRGVLSVAIASQESKRFLIVPEGNAAEAGLLKSANIFYASHLLDVCAHLKGEKSLPVCEMKNQLTHKENKMNLSEVRGQAHAKRALEIAAAGKHNLLFIGPPGTGKTMLALRLSTILPPLNDEEALESATINSMGINGFDPNNWKQLPFRSPHHGSSSAALVGGGRPPKPGEISLAHNGILFLDELPEFSRHVLEALREPLESGHITISRAAFQMLYPARFQMIAAMNPCPCGYARSKYRDCSCTLEQVNRYRNKLSGPLIDRIDMQVEVGRLANDLLTSPVAIVDESKLVREKVIAARSLQFERQQKINKDLTVNELVQYCNLDKKAQYLLDEMVKKLNLSARNYHRVIKVARTIADLSENFYILEQHISEAFTFRCFDTTT